MMMLLSTALRPVFVSLVLAVALAGTARAQTSIAPAVERAAVGTAHVSVLFTAGSDDGVRVERASSGIVLDARGLVLTNNHLVAEVEVGGGGADDEFRLMVLIGQARPCSATLIARDERLDLALLQLELEEGELIGALELAAETAPPAGADVLATGVPRGGQFFALAGVVAFANGPVTLGEGTLAPDEVLLSDAALLGDVDGGPLVDRSGRVLGIVNTSHRLTEAPADEEEAKEFALKPDYALIVGAEAIRRAFAEQLGARGAASAAGVDGAEVTAALVQAAAGAVVSVWAGAQDARPAQPEPSDPYAQRPGAGLGSGVIIDPRGLVLTSAAVVGEATEVSVRLLDGSTHTAEVLKVRRPEPPPPPDSMTLEEIMGARPERGTALLRLRLAEGVTVPALELGSSDAALSGEVVAVVGNPYGHTPTLSSGVLAALEVEERLRVGAWIHDGHKGGAVLDVTGRLIGIADADIHEDAEPARPESYLGVAVPIDRVREWFAAEYELHGSAPSLKTAPVATEAELERRRNRVTEIVAATRDSLLNVEVKAEEKNRAVFDPFATPGEFKLLGQGSGVVIDPSGLALTNWHVVDAALGDDGGQRNDRSVEVTLPSGKRYTARVLSTSRDDDLGLIQLELPEGESVQPITLGHTGPLRRGDVAVAIGNPFGKANTVTVGIVAAKNQDAKIQGRLHIYEGMLQTDAAINPGNSGGALLDIQGRLIGINSAGRSGAGLAIPVERVRDVFGAKLLSARQLRSAELGMSVKDTADGGVYVREIDAHGPAERVGIAVGDRVLTLDGQGVERALDVSLALLAARPMVTVRLELERDGERLVVEPQPVSHTAWRIFRQTGIEFAEVDYRGETALVREASVELHRAYTGLDDAEPSHLMSGALRVVQVVPPKGVSLDVQAGDLLLGMLSTVRTIDSEHTELVRFESLEALRQRLEPIASHEGHVIECWLLRDGEVRTAEVKVVRVR